MSEISEDLRRQMAERGKALLSDFLERKPDYDGPTLSDEENQKLENEAKDAAKVRAEAILAHVRELGDDY